MLQKYFYSLILTNEKNNLHIIGIHIIMLFDSVPKYELISLIQL